MKMLCLVSLDAVARDVGDSQQSVDYCEYCQAGRRMYLELVAYVAAMRRNSVDRQE